MCVLSFSLPYFQLLTKRIQYILDMRISTVFVVFILFMLVVVVGGWFIYSNNQTVGNNSNQTATGRTIPGIGGGPPESAQFQSSPSAMSRVQLQTLLTQHGMLASNHLQNIYDGEDSSDSREELEGNSFALATYFASLGGSRDEFLMMWDGHIQEYENYTNALKNNDRSGTEEARAALSMHAQAMGRMTQMISPNFSEELVRQLMEEHIDLTLGIIEAHSRGDMTERTKLMGEASSQAIRFANTIADGLDTTSE